MLSAIRDSLARILPLSLVTAALAVSAAPASPAFAEDDCGSGYHKDSDGEMVGKNIKTADGRRVTASINGYVRFCTRERTFYDQRAQRVLVGVPKDFIAQATFGGGRSQRPCMSVQIAVKVANVESFSGGASISWPAGVSGDWSISYDDQWVKTRYSLCAERKGATRLRILPPDGLTVTADDVSCYVTPSGPGPGCYVYPHVDRVVITVTANMTYRSGDTETKIYASHEETDLASQS